MDSSISLCQPAQECGADGVDAAAVPARKAAGAYFTPPSVAETLVRWAVRSRDDRMLDPSCGDGRFVSAHLRSVGIEQDAATARVARERAPSGEIHVGDFFAWAERTEERFDCAAGNPPFIRYQRFSGDIRERALRLCKGQGVAFSGLASSWAPFLVATASLLKPGGRMAFVVPAEIGHAPYAAPFLDFAVERFSVVHLVAVRRKLFPELSEDCWLLFADGFGGGTQEIRLSVVEDFTPTIDLIKQYESVPVAEWQGAWGRRLRPFLMAPRSRAAYRRLAADAGTQRLSDVATVGIGYVSGANDFFHLRPSEAAHLGIPAGLLRPAVRNGRALTGSVLAQADVDRWLADDLAVLLLRLPRTGAIPGSVAAYLDSPAGRRARTAYKCRVRHPWYSVPDVQIPDYILSYMSGSGPVLARNDARCVATNSVHCVTVRPGRDARRLREAWGTPAVTLSCELEGHPLGGGMLKLEPREAGRVVLPSPDSHRPEESEAIREGIEAMRLWRHRAS